MTKRCTSGIDHSILWLQQGKMLRVHRCLQGKEIAEMQIIKSRHISSLENAVKLYKIKINLRVSVQRLNTTRTKTAGTCLESSQILWMNQEIDRKALSTLGVVEGQKNQGYHKLGIIRKK